MGRAKLDLCDEGDGGPVESLPDRAAVGCLDGNSREDVRVPPEIRRPHWVRREPRFLTLEEARKLA